MIVKSIGREFTKFATIYRKRMLRRTSTKVHTWDREVLKYFCVVRVNCNKNCYYKIFLELKIKRQYHHTSREHLCTGPLWSIHYAWCARFGIKGRMWTISKLEYIHYSQFVFFQSTNLPCISKNSANANFSFGDARSYCLEERSRASQCTHKSESASTHYAQFPNFWRFHS